MECLLSFMGSFCVGKIKKHLESLKQHDPNMDVFFNEIRIKKQFLRERIHPFVDKVLRLWKSAPKRKFMERKSVKVS